jgi:eukaryotic-like serine/threonine-protein kinase
MISVPESTPDLAGTVLEGAYRLVRLIGQGGMGAVYEATQLRLGKRVAVKLMSREAAADQVSLERFRREAEITSKLGHPHLVNLVDFGTAETGQPYLVMEYLEGEDLDQRLQKAIRLPIDIAATIVTQAASALGAAHAQDVVHRDLKPANLFLLQVPGEPEFVKVLDFGISKVKAANGRRLTGVQSVVGTPAYMSPEQATGRSDETDHRADQWALACIAWEMMCGHPPFMADDTTALFFQIIRIEPAPLVNEVPELQPAAEAVLRRALSKRHTDRYSSIREFARAFEMAALGYATDATPPPVSIKRTSETSSVNALRKRTPDPSLADTIASADAIEPPIEPTATAVRVPRLTPGWRLISVFIAAAVALAVLGSVLVRSPRASTKPESLPQPTAAHPNVVALPADRTAAAAPITAPTAQPENAVTYPSPSASPAASRPVRTKIEKPKPPARVAGKNKAAPTGQNKHRLFEEL